MVNKSNSNPGKISTSNPKKRHTNVFQASRMDQFAKAGEELAEQMVSVQTLEESKENVTETPVDDTVESNTESVESIIEDPIAVVTEDSVASQNIPIGTHDDLSEKGAVAEPEQMKIVNQGRLFKTKIKRNIRSIYVRDDLNELMDYLSKNLSIAKGKVVDDALMTYFLSNDFKSIFGDNDEIAGLIKKIESNTSI